MRGGPHDGEEVRVSGIWVECGGHIWGDRPPTTCQYTWKEDESGVYAEFEHEYIMGTDQIV